jgi:hypothetical protein
MVPLQGQARDAARSPRGSAHPSCQELCRKAAVAGGTEMRESASMRPEDEKLRPWEGNRGEGV